MKQKVYAPDIDNYEFEGRSGLFGTVAALFVGPVRLVMRVVHNIVILPVDFLPSYVSALSLVSASMTVLGIIDYLAFHRWPLLVSQLPVFIYGRYLRHRIKMSASSSEGVREVEIDTEQIEAACNSITDELDTIVGKDR